jgi:phosphatidylglycerophosphate synthase
MRKSDVQWNVPNVLSAYRLVVVPIILGTIALRQRDIFFMLICVSLATDILDGWIARHFHLETEFGARLDSLADNATYFMAFLGFVLLESDFLFAHLAAFGLLLSFKVIPHGISIWRFGRSTSLHLYSSKATGYIQGFFVLGYFVLGYSAWYFHFMIVFSVLASVEKLVILMIIPELRSNMRGLYWILQAAPDRS